jgi:hypothetical protein
MIGFQKVCWILLAWDNLLDIESLMIRDLSVLYQNRQGF